MSIERNTSGQQNRPISGKAIWLGVGLLLLLDSGVLLSWAPPVKADSEASSESATESGGLGRRRRRYRPYMQQNMQQQKMENQHERNVHRDQQRQDQHMRNLRPGQVVHNYKFPPGHTQRQTTQPTPAQQQLTPATQKTNPAATR